MTDRGDPDNCVAAPCSAALSSDIKTVTITVSPVNDKPTADPKTLTTDEDTAGAVTLSGSDTETASANLSYTITLAPAHGSLSGTAPNLTYTPNANYNGPDSFKYTVTDRGDPDNCGAPSATCAAAETSTEATVSITVTPVNDAPVANGDAYNTNEDTPLNVAAPGVLGNDTDVENDTLTATLVSGPSHASSFALNADGSFSYTPALNYNGPDSFTYKACDTGTSGSPLLADPKCSAAATVSITVNAVNDAPANVTASVSPASIDENQSATVSGTFTDPESGDPHTVTINWGSTEGTSTYPVLPGTSYSVTHQYKDDNPTNTTSDNYGITVVVCDGGADGNTATTGDNLCSSPPATTSLTVKNVAPVVTSVTGPLGPMALGSPVTITATFTDVGTQDTHKCSFDWDETPPQVTGNVSPTETNGSGSCSASHTYSAPGVYSVTVTVTDDDTGTGSRSFDLSYVVIYDPNGGFVTGGGWINSGAGSYLANGSATGKASFGFVSKYQTGKTATNVPTGETEFQFKDGDLNFHSSAYDAGSLVISGYKATYRGTGTINGAGSYKFLVIAYDGDRPGGGGIDRFRIKITNLTTNTVVYDNQMGSSEDPDLSDGTALSGGSIVIHK